MCTASLIPIHDPDHPGRVIGVRLITNRDELRKRPPAAPPAWFPIGDSGWRAVYPIDPVGGGTWVAASTGGLILCLLNANPPPPPSLPHAVAADASPDAAAPNPGLASRGLIIPSLLDSASARVAASRVQQLELTRFAPFTLLAADLAVNGPERQPDRGAGASASPGGACSRIWRAYWDGRTVSIDQLGAAPICVASSGLGDALVAPRLPLFDSMVREADRAMHLPSVQDRFHRHRWPSRPEISVLMSRRDARTVSITTVELLAGGAGGMGGAGSTGATVTMVYEAIEREQVAAATVEHAADGATPTLCVRHHAPVVATVVATGAA